MASTIIGKVAITPKGNFNINTSYVKFDLVSNAGSSYVCLKDCKGIQVTNTEYWQLMAEKGEKPLNGTDYNTVEEKNELKHDVIEQSKVDLEDFFEEQEQTFESSLSNYSSTLKNAFDTNATEKTSTFNQNVTEKTTEFNNNATTKTNTFNENAILKTNEFDENAERYNFSNKIDVYDTKRVKTRNLEMSTKTDNLIDSDNANFWNQDDVSKYILWSQYIEYTGGQLNIAMLYSDHSIMYEDAVVKYSARLFYYDSNYNQLEMLDLGRLTDNIGHRTPASSNIAYVRLRLSSNNGRVTPSPEEFAEADYKIFLSKSDIGSTLTEENYYPAYTFDYVKKDELEEVNQNIDEIESNIEVLQEQVGEKLADVYIDEISRVRNIANNQSFGLNFIFATDIHLRNENDLYKMKIIRDCGEFADFICLNGDIIDGSRTLSGNEVRKLLADGVNIAKSKAPAFCTFGNHDDNFYGVQTFGNDALINNLQFSNLTQKGLNNEIFDSKYPMQNWYYVDYPKYKIRVIFFNFCVGFDDDGNLIASSASSSFGVPNEEILWLRDKALRFNDKEDKEEWAVIVCSHHNPVKDENIGYMNLYNVGYFSKMLQAFKNGTSFTITDQATHYGEDNVFDFTEQGQMEVIGVFSGHQHLDCVSTNNEYGILCISTNCDYQYQNETVEVQTASTPITTKSAPTREDGTATTESFDIVKIDRKNQKVIMTRYGAGNSREVTMI